MYTVDEAIALYRDRRDRRQHPAGSFDKAGRWYPDDDTETQPCCGRIRNPSQAFPYSLMKHCRSAEHVANLTGVPASILRNSVERHREGGESYYKAVADLNGRYFSIFDGETEYRIGETLREPARQSHNGGFYVYPTVADARRAAVPRDSALKDAPRVVVRVRAEGAYCRYANGKLAFSRVTPLEVVPC